MAIATACRSELGRFESIWPTPAGGMKLDRISEMRKAFGDDTLFLIGGALLEQGPDLEKDAQLFAHCCGRDQPYTPITNGLSRGVNVSSPTDDSPDSSLPSISEVNQVAFKLRRRVLEYTLYNK